MIADKATLNIETLFADWRERNLWLDAEADISDDDVLAASIGIWGMADAALALPPLTIADLYRKIVLAMANEGGIDPDSPLGRLHREARAALGLPLSPR